MESKATFEETGEEGITSLNGEIARDETTVTLTEAGLLPDRATEVADLYAEQENWGRVKEVWHDRRVGKRGTRGSSQQIFRILKARLQSGAGRLPAVSRLSALLSACSSRRQRSQLLYFYLVEQDSLFRYTLHEVLLEGRQGETWPVDKNRVRQHLESFRYEDGEPLEYADATLERWAEGFRSVLHDIGAREAKYDDEASSPTLERIPLNVAAGYSWHLVGDDWVQFPIGWAYLFQSADIREPLFERIGDEPHWQVTNLRTQMRLEPVDGRPFSFEL